ncbi:MAG TPA: hypothetical protein VEZ51_09090, partial [Gemmatimonadaceae bacterium]|nr:hypothetical protein [Gemmatimonadaceae bacterium]
EMWSAIQAKRAGGPRVVYGGGLVTAGGPQKRFGARVWMGAAAAALVLVATGVGIGRWSAGLRPASIVATRVPAQSAPEAPAETSVGAPSADTQVAAVNPASTNVSSNSGGRRSVAGRPTVGEGLSGSSETRVATGGAPSSPTSGSAYQLTTISHLSEAEALLTSFRARSTADQQMDSQLGAWARQLLSNTRLLLDSPVANDPQRRPLLEDLELVLVQIVQLSPGSTPQDRELIEKTLQQDHVMTRLRTAIPAGAQRGS